MSRETGVSAPIYRLVEVSKQYGSTAVLDRLSFDLEVGTSMVIMGRSGSGKSVTLRLMDGLETPDSGNILFDGTEITTLPERALSPMRLRVAMLFQGGALFDSMNVADNLAFPLRRHSAMTEPEIQQKVRQTLALVDMDGVEDRMPSALSGGMRKRAALARSLIMDPEVVLFDEPTTGLDPLTSATIARLIRSIQARLNMTSVVVTHDIPLARRVGDRVAFLEGGRFSFLGTWDEADRSAGRRFTEFLNAERTSDAA